MYQRILVSIDLVPESGTILAQAKKIAEIFQADLEVVTVMELNLTPCYGSVYAGVGIAETIDGLRAEARKELDKILLKHDIPTDHGRILSGKASDEILLLAKKSKSDLIIIGSHGRHGIRLLLGSTANAVLHHASCDVLAIKL